MDGRSVMSYAVAYGSQSFPKKNTYAQKPAMPSSCRLAIKNSVDRSF